METGCHCRRAALDLAIPQSLLAEADEVIVGLLVLALALYEIWDERRHMAHPA